MGGLLQREVLPHQYKAIYSKARFPCLVAGFGSGKSEAMVMKVLKQLFEVPKAQIAVYEPTVDLIKRIMYPRFEEILADTGLIYKLNKSEGTLTINNVGTIIFRSLENPSRIIGYEVHHSHVDELDTVDDEKAEDAWMKILSRNRKRIPDGSMNTVSAYTTPEGYKFTYKRWHKHRLKDIENKGYSDYELIKGSTYDNPFLDQSYVENLENSYPSNLIKAYLNGEFVNLESGQVYTEFDTELNDSNAEIQNDSETLHIGMDFNVNHMSATVGVKRGREFHIVDEICDMADTPSMIYEIKKRYDGHGLIIYPDASGSSRKTVDASKSDIGLLKEAGFRVSAAKKNPPVKDRILTANTMFCNSKGERKLFVNSSKCPNLVDNLNEQAYDDNGNPRKANNVDHMLDALGYVVYRLYGISRGASKVTRFKM
jgi:PBSX family phage terminase large subunit